jgi:type IX secretion system PorP/SprF family membrane protein
MRTKFYLVAFFIAIGLAANAQDLHFSQYYASPLTLNPALCGKFDGLARVEGIYRGQYYGLSQNASIFSTPAASIDFSLLKDKGMEGNALGVGLSVVNDAQTSTATDGSGGVGKINTTSIALELAYTIQLMRRHPMQLSIGFEPSVTIKNTSGNYEYPQAFNSQLVYQTGSPYNESFTQPKKTYFNLAYGLFFNHKPIDILTYFLGFSMNNVTRPQTDVIAINNSIGKLNFLYILHGGLEITVARRCTLIPGFLYQNEAKANEANAGITFGYDVLDRDNSNGVRQKATIFLGLWNRMGNDVGSPFQYRNITPKLGLDYRGFRIDFAYDISVGNIASDAQPVPGIYRPQAYEIAVSYIFGAKGLKEREFLFNPRY